MFKNDKSDRKPATSTPRKASKTGMPMTRQSHQKLATTTNGQHNFLAWGTSDVDTVIYFPIMQSARFWGMGAWSLGIATQMTCLL